MKGIRIVLLCICLLLTGCSQDGTSIVEQAKENMENWNSYRFSMQTMSDVNLEHIGHIQLVCVSNGDVQFIPQFLMKMDSNISMAYHEEKPQTLAFTQYISQQNGQEVLYQNLQGAWVKADITGSKAAIAASKHPVEMMESYLANRKSVSVIGSEMINGVECDKIRLVLSTDGLEEVIGGFLWNQTGFYDSKAFTQYSNQEVETIFWIGKEDMQLYKQELDASPLIKDALAAQLQKEGENAPDVSQAILTMQTVYSDINLIDDLAIPLEAQNAPEMTIQ